MWSLAAENLPVGENEPTPERRNHQLFLRLRVRLTVTNYRTIAPNQSQRMLLLELQFLFDMLLTTVIAVELRGRQLPAVSQKICLSDLHKFSQQLTFTNGLSAEQYQQTMQHHHNMHKEPHLCDSRL